MGVQVDWEYDSTTIALLPRASGTYGIRQLVMPTDFGAAEGTPWLTPVPFGTGQIEQGYVFDKPRTVNLVVKVIAGSEAKAYAEMDLIQGYFSPERLGKLRLRYTSQTGSVDRYLECRRLLVPSMSFPGPVTLRGNPQGGMLIFAVQLMAAYPHWRDYTATTTPTIALKTTTENGTITNPGRFPIGCKVSLSSLVGTWTSITVTNTTTGNMMGESSTSGGAVVWTDNAFADGNYLDWRYTDPSIVTYNNGTINATANLILWPGDNAIQVIGVGGTSGTVTFTRKGAYA